MNGLHKATKSPLHLKVKGRCRRVFDGRRCERVGTVDAYSTATVKVLKRKLHVIYAYPAVRGIGFTHRLLSPKASVFGQNQTNHTMQMTYVHRLSRPKY